MLSIVLPSASLCGACVSCLAVGLRGCGAAHAQELKLHSGMSRELKDKIVGVLR